MRVKQKNTICIALVFFAAVLFTASSYLWAGEHPTEHPTEHTSEQPTQQPVKQIQPITKDALAAAVENYVKEKAEASGGYFPFVDAKESKALSLTLVRVHKDRLARIKEDVYFACADFREKGGDMYDLDIFMQGQSAEQLKMTDISLHKKNGEPRYTWVEDNGLWKQKKE